MTTDMMRMAIWKMKSTCISRLYHVSYLLHVKNLSGLKEGVQDGWRLFQPNPCDPIQPHRVYSQVPQSSEETCLCARTQENSHSHPLHPRLENHLQTRRALCIEKSGGDLSLT